MFQPCLYYQKSLLPFRRREGVFPFLSSSTSLLILLFKKNRQVTGQQEALGTVSGTLLLPELRLVGYPSRSESFTDPSGEAASLSEDTSGSPVVLSVGFAAAAACRRFFPPFMGM